MSLPFYLFAIGLTAWYAGAGPAALSVVLSILFSDYYFIEPRYSFYPTVSEIPHLIVFSAFASLVAWFSAVRRRVEMQQRHAGLTTDPTDPRATRPREIATSIWYRIATAACALGIFIADSRTNNEIAVAALYVVVVLMAAFFLHSRGILAVAAGCVALTVTGLLLPVGSAMTGVANTLISISAIAITAFLIVQSQSAKVTLKGQSHLLNLTHDTIFVRDMNDVIAFWNRGAEELYGWTAREAVGKMAHELLKTGFPVPLQQIENELLRTGRWEGELVHTRKFGTPVVVASRWSLERDHKGLPIAVLETNNDISERKRAEEALRRSEAYLAEAQRLSHTGSWAYNPSTGRTLYWSDETFRIFGLDPQRDASDREDFVRLLHPEDREKVLADTEKAIREKADYAYDHRIMLPDGTVRYVHVSGHPVIDQKGEIVEYVGTTVDVTERKRAEDELRASEARYRTFVDFAADPFLLHRGEDGSILDVNQQACDSLGYTPEELIGMPISSFDACVSLDAAFMQQLRRRLDAGETFGFETSHRRKDGTVFPVEVRVRPFWHDGRYFNVSFTRDITERKRAEEELRKAEAAKLEMSLEARVNERTRIARELHDTLLQSFQGLMLRFQTVYEMLPERPMDAKKALEAALDRADQAISEGRDAITDIRTSTWASQDLAKSISALMTNLSEELSGGNGSSVRFRIRVEGAPRTLRPALQDDIYRIAQESLRNAFCHAQARHIETEITYGDSLRLRFRDDGKGIDPSVLKHGGRSRHWGLPGIRERANHIGAQLEVWSELGAGTEIELSIPGSLAYEVFPTSARLRLSGKRTEQDHEHRS